MVRTRAHLKRKLIDRMSPSDANNETMTEAEIVANSAVTHAEFVRLIDLFIIIYEIFSSRQLELV